MKLTLINGLNGPFEIDKIFSDTYSPPARVPQWFSGGGIQTTQDFVHNGSCGVGGWMMNFHSIGGHRGFEGWWGMYVLKGAHYTELSLAISKSRRRLEKIWTFVLALHTLSFIINLLLVLVEMLTSQHTLYKVFNGYPPQAWKKL